jgi:hypothetical protein
MQPQAHIYGLDFPDGMIYIGSKVGDITNYWGSYDETTAERIRRNHTRLGLDPTPTMVILRSGPYTTKNDLLKREMQFITEYRANDPAVGYNRMPMTRKNNKYKQVLFIHDPVEHLVCAPYPWGTYVWRCDRQPDGMCNRRGDHQPWGDAPDDGKFGITWPNGMYEDLRCSNNWRRCLQHKNRMASEWEDKSVGD